MSGIPDVLYFLPQGVCSQDLVITATDTEISDMIQKADLNMYQERSSCAVDLELQSYFDYVVQNEIMAYPSNNWTEGKNITAQKMKFSIKDFSSKCDKIGSFLRTWSHFLKKYLIENFIFCTVHVSNNHSCCKCPWLISKHPTFVAFY